MNTRSLLKHEDEIFITLGANEFICLSETWLSPRNMLTVNFYTYIRQDRNDPIHQSNVKSCGGGGRGAYGILINLKLYPERGARIRNEERGSGTRNETSYDFV